MRLSTEIELFTRRINMINLVFICFQIEAYVRTVITVQTIDKWIVSFPNALLLLFYLSLYTYHTILHFVQWCHTEYFHSLG